MLKYMMLITMSVFGAASIAVAGMPIATMSMRPITVKPETHGSGGTSAPISVTNPRLAPSIRRIVPGITVAPVPNRRRLPDLVIRSAVIRPAQGAASIVAAPACRPGSPVLYVTARVENIGHGPSAAKASVGMVQARVTGGVNWGNGHGLPALAPGAMASVTFPIYYLQSNPGYMHGSHTFKLTVNAGRWVRESNYANNGFRPVRITLPSDFCRSAKSPKTHKQAPGFTVAPPNRRRLPDLIPLVSNPFSGIIRVKNIGAATAGASKLTVNCKKLGGGDCPSTKALNSIPTDASGALLESVRELHAGEVYTISLPVQGLTWDPSADYRFTYNADATHVVAESNEINNKRVWGIARMHKIGGSATHGKMPDLIPLVSNPFNGVIKVKNIGAATAVASKLTVNCKKIGGGFAASAGDCPSTRALDLLPADASGALLESVPALPAGQVYRISLPVQGLEWDKGKYRFTYKTDATHTVDESNESNNVKTVVRQREWIYGEG